MALRQGLETIREAIGDKFLIGCGMPLGLQSAWSMACVSALMSPSHGATAAGPAAPSTYNALATTIARLSSHGQLWLNDPDCAIVRRRGDDNNLTHEEARTFLAVAA